MIDLPQFIEIAKREIKAKLTAQGLEAHEALIEQIVDYVIELCADKGETFEAFNWNEFQLTAYGSSALAAQAEKDLYRPTLH